MYIYKYILFSYSLYITFQYMCVWGGENNASSSSNNFVLTEGKWLIFEQPPSMVERTSANTVHTPTATAIGRDVAAHR